MQLMESKLVERIPVLLSVSFSITVLVFWILHFSQHVKFGPGFFSNPGCDALACYVRRSQFTLHDFDFLP